MARKKMTGKDAEDRLAGLLREWQEVEDRSIRSINEIVQKIENPLVKQVLQVIQHDSSMHRRVQQFILDSLEKRAISLAPGELGNAAHFV